VNAARWQEIKTAFNALLELDPALRPLEVGKMGTLDPELGRALEALLAAHEQESDEFLEVPAAALEPVEEGPEEDSRLGTHVGPYQLVREIGSGGMGEVYLARRVDTEFEHQVAIKLVRSGQDSAAVVRRFRAERQILANLDHPNIAKLLDGGRTAQGQPYFVMEYVPGLPITEYCDQHRLTLRERIELFIQACEGVQHAHQNAIIHRDLKPANILVVEVDGKPVPRIIDFGIAKAASLNLTDQTLLTRFGHFIGTPGYMSPEQADPNAKSIDSRTDVYSLGAILYVLLTGLQPFETAQGQMPPLDVWLRRLREEEPPRPSGKLKAERDAATTTSAARGTTLRQLGTELRGDLDWITMNALERDRERRYGTPSEFAADLRRYLNHEPVMARPATPAYRIGKYIRRHWVATVAAGALVLLLGAFSMLQAMQLRAITRERDRATRMTDFMTAMFKVSDPSEARGSSVTAREILDKASQDASQGLTQDPEVQSQMLYVMASTYLNLGLYGRAHELAQQALDLRLRLNGSADPKTLESMSLLGWILSRERHDADAEKLERQALAGEQKVLGAEDPETLRTKDYLAITLQHQGHGEQAEPLEREVVDVATSRLGPENPLTLESMNHLGVVQLTRGEYTDAESTYRRLLEVERRVLGDDHPESLKALTNLASALRGQERWAEAEPLVREALAIDRRVLGPEHQNTVKAMYNLATMLIHDRQFAEAEELTREVLAIDTRTLGPDHPDTLIAEAGIGEVLYKKGALDEAETWQRRTLATRIRVLGPKSVSTLVAQSNLAGTLIREGHYAEAEKLARDAFENQREQMGAQHFYTLDALQQLGKALAYEGQYSDAVALYHQVIDQKDRLTGQGNPWLAWYGFACVAMAANRADEALGYLREAVKNGYKDVDEMAADEDLKDLRSNLEFKQMVAGLKGADGGR